MNIFDLMGKGGTTPEGSISITENGTHDVTNYASANVNVPNPSTGTLGITKNGKYDVTEYASANVNVPTETPTYKTATITLSADSVVSSIHVSRYRILSVYPWSVVARFERMSYQISPGSAATVNLFTEDTNTATKMTMGMLMLSWQGSTNITIPSKSGCEVELYGPNTGSTYKTAVLYIEQIDSSVTPAVTIKIASAE